MAKKTETTPQTDLAANLDKATAAPKKVTVGKRPAPVVPVESNETEVQDLPARPGSPCKVAGCLGRYSILHTEKIGRERVRKLICRTCKHQPGEPHRSPL